MGVGGDSMGCHGLEYEHGFIKMSRRADCQRDISAATLEQMEDCDNFKNLRGTFDDSVNVSHSG